MQKERFFSPLQIAVELQLWDTLNIQIHWYTEFTDILKGPVVQTLMLQMRETEAFLLVGTWSQNSWFPTNLETKICGSVKKLYVLCLVTQLCPILCDPMDYSPPGFSLSMRILQARILEWVAMPSFRGSSLPRDWTQVSCIAGGFFTIWTTREAQEYSWVAYPFSRGSSWPSSRTRISLIGGGFFTSWASREAPNSTVSKRLMFEYFPNGTPKNILFYMLYFYWVPNCS